MTLSEIETILQELAARHPNLTEELLTTLLLASGWEEKTIKEALVLFKQNKGAFLSAKVPTTQAAPQPVEKPVSALSEEAITFYQPDGTEEGKLHAFADVPVPQEKEKRPEVKIAQAQVPEIKNEVKVPQPEVIAPAVTPIVAQAMQRQPEVRVPEKIVTPPVVVEPAPQVIPPVPPVMQPPTTEPQSLIIHDEVQEKRSTEKQGVLPGNLPLLPFESSPHIWSFAKYKDVFHKDTTPAAQEEIKVINVMPQVEVTQPFFQVSQDEKPKVHVNDIEVIVESVPLRKDDKPLVFLATIMLFAIILILGYMYSNGRL